MKKPTNKELLEKKDSFMLIKFGYSTDYIVPHKEGVKIIQAMEHAELQSTSGGYDCHIIKPLTNSDVLTYRAISQKDYLDQKMAHLMGVTVKELNAPPTEPT